MGDDQSEVVNDLFVPLQQQLIAVTDHELRFGRINWGLVYTKSSLLPE